MWMFAKNAGVNMTFPAGSTIDQKTFRFMIDDVLNFAKYIMDAMAHRIRGMGRNIA